MAGADGDMPTKGSTPDPVDAVIATNWSGPTAFMDEGNSYLLATLGLMEVATGPWTGHRWAAPSGTDLRRLLRRVTTHPQEAAARGRYCNTPLSWIHICNLDRVEQFPEWADVPTDVLAEISGHQHHLIGQYCRADVRGSAWCETLLQRWWQAWWCGGCVKLRCN